MKIDTCALCLFAVLAFLWCTYLLVAQLQSPVAAQADDYQPLYVVFSTGNNAFYTLFHVLLADTLFV